MLGLGPAAAIGAVGQGDPAQPTVQVAEAVSSDGAWEVVATAPAKLRVGRPSEALVRVAARPGKAGCAALTRAILDMPAHGHGTDFRPAVARQAACRWRVHGIVPTMRGEWRLRLVLVDGDRTSVADLTLDAR